MTASELHRQLLFFGYDEVTDYLKNSPLNRHIYKKLLDLLPDRNVDVPMVSLFNEIYFQCVRVSYDAQPGLDVNQRYVIECAEWLKSQKAAEVVFAAVWAIFHNKRVNFQEECFIDQLTHCVRRGEFSDFATNLEYDIHLMEISIPDTFPTLTRPVDALPEMDADNESRKSIANYINEVLGESKSLDEKFEELREYQKAWRKATCNFSHTVIEKFVGLYTTPTDQLKLIDRIENALSREEVITHTVFFKELVGKIKTGNFSVNTADYEYDEYQHNLAVNQAAENEGPTREEVLEQQCDDLKRQIEEMKTSHELELAKTEKRYQAEIDKLNAQLGSLQKKVPAPVQDAQPSLPIPAAMPITIDEMVDYVKSKFTKTNAEAFVLMLYRLAQAKKITDENFFSIIDGIDTAIQKRDAVQQIVLNQPDEVNFNPQNVNNYNN